MHLRLFLLLIRSVSNHHVDWYARLIYILTMATSKNILGVGPQTVVHPHRTYGERTVPMEVLCLGYGRTGTRSLRDQLLTLGFHHSYHTFDAVYRDFYDCKLWIDLLEAKYDRGEKPLREDFDKLLGHCKAVVDMPAAYFAEELIEYYPDAKVILTIRDPESWARYAPLICHDKSNII
ncbi:hypothetical protein HZ326_29801 [Fusarium oxysporum f. sp. albedinis]|nr:hypothetical protein HZ326_29801 [Fusarium oxysporum f. sp. albedinis]